jgi:threonine dehydrogenase-like Zn-dependent dehydrogenase
MRPELKRRGAPRVQVLTGRPDPAVDLLPGVAVAANAEPGRHRFVVDATGRAEAAARLVASGGTLALLGTPGPEETLSAAGLHRGGWTVLGWHELAGHDPAVDQDLYRQIAAWLTDTVEPHQLSAWCRRWPGEQAERLYASLTGPNRPAEPVLLLEWT